MKLSRKWVQEDFLNLTGISDETILTALNQLGFEAKLGASLDEDRIFEIEVPENRLDCRCIVGICRELSAALNIPMAHHQPQVRESELGSIFEYLDIDVPAENGCRRFSARMATHVTVKNSPDWMQKRLLRCGISPVNNIVDICHYVLLETGQQVFCFDYRGIPNGCLLIREAFDGEILSGPNGSFSTLSAGTPVLSDENYELLGIAGVLEAPDFKIREDTENLIFAAADFDLTQLKEVCKSLSLPVPEACPDALLTVPAVNRACELLELLSCGETLDGTLDILNYVPQPRTLDLEENALSCMGLSLSVAEALLEKLEIFSENGTVTLPSFRPDLKSSDDLLDEIRRILSASSDR